MSCRSPRRDTQLREQDAGVDMHDAGLASRRPSYIVVTPSYISLLNPIATSRSASTSRSVNPSRPPAQRLGQFRQGVVDCSHR